MAVTFTASSYLSTTSVPALQMDTANSSFAIWVYITSIATTGVAGPVSSGGDTFNLLGVVGSGATGAEFNDVLDLQVYNGTGSLYLEIATGAYTAEEYFEDGTMPLNQWTHVAGTRVGAANAGGTRVLYINGAAVSATPGSNPTIGSVAWDRLLVGGFAGDAQDAWIFNRVLTAGEIQRLSRERFPVIDRTSIVAHYPLLAGSSKGMDFSGKGRHLTATGTVADSTRQSPGVPWFGVRERMVYIASGTLALSGTATTGTGTSGALAQAQPLAGTATAGTGTSAALAQAQPLVGAATSGTGASGALAQTESLVGTAGTGTGASGTATQQQALAGTSTTGTGTSATLSNDGKLTLVGTGATGTGGSGTLSIQGTNALSGTASTGAGAAGTLAQTQALVGAAATGTSTNATLSNDGKLTLVGLATLGTGAIGTLSNNGSTAITGSGSTGFGAFGVLSGGTPSGSPIELEQTGSERRWLAAHGARRASRR